MLIRLALAGAFALARRYSSVLALLLLWSAAHAFDNGQYNDVPPKIRDWFKSIRSPLGIPCCDIADGHPTDFEFRPDGYWIPTPGNPRVWMRVPPEAVVDNAGNPTGGAVVWTGHQFNGEISIRCFVAGAGG